MIALYLVAAHLFGDFVLQNRWQSAGKLHDARLRMQHVFFYCVPFWPVAAVYGHRPWWHGAAFIVLLYGLHFLTDSYRFHSTLGDVVQWRIDSYREPLVVKRAWLEYVTGAAESAGLRAVDVDDSAVRWPTPNPWPAIPLMVDQTLHLCQLAVLAGVFLT